VFLLVLACRGALALHEAVACIRGAAESGLSLEAIAAPVGTADDAAVHFYIVSALQVLNTMIATMGMSQPTAVAATAGVVQVTGEDGSSSSRPVYWQHLLRLRDSRKLKAVLGAHWGKWTNTAANAVLKDNMVTDKRDTLDRIPAASRIAAKVNSQQMAQMRQLYHDSLAVCRTLVALVPLPVVCNNPRCVDLSGVSEAAAAHYVCAGCVCRYCSAACQAAGWRSRKKACRRMAAYGLRVDRR
jgi:hypothetical protein